jgi:hypothetical protein
MIDLGMTRFHIDVPSLPRSEFQRYSTHLFDEWERNIESALVLPDYSLALEVEEGSVKGIGRIAATLGVIYMAIGNYGSFISGLETIGTQVSRAGDLLVDHAVDPFNSQSAPAKVRKSRRGGALGELHGLFVKVQSGALTPEQAMQEATALLGGEGDDAPNFLREMQGALEQASQFPLFNKSSQVPISLDEQWDMPMQSLEGRGKPPRRSPVLPMTPAPAQFRVEVWRESKKKKRNIRVVAL